MWVPAGLEEVEQWAELPADRSFGSEFRRLWQLGLEWLTPYYDGLHLARAAYWVCRLEPDVPEPVIIASLTHDMERSVPGGPLLDKARIPWDDPGYNRAHCERSAAVVQEWLRRHDAPDEFVAGVERPILEHEFGGSPEGDLAQGADSLSFLETCLPRVVGWVEGGDCDLAKGRAKVDFMFERIRLERAREIARPLYDRFHEGLTAAFAGG